MNTYQMIIQFFQSLNFAGPSLRQACLDGTLPVSYRQAQRVVRKATQRGDLRLARSAGEHGRPLKVSEK